MNRDIFIRTIQMRYLSAIIMLLPALFGPKLVAAQIERHLAEPDGPVDELFMAPHIIVVSSVTNLDRGNLNFTINHVFGRLDSGAGSLWGLDDSANIRIGLDYGVSDGLSVGVGRSRFDKLYDFRFKANILRQSRTGSMPIEVAVKGDLGIMTEPNGFEFRDRLNYLGAALIARRFSDRISVQVSPMISHFPSVGSAEGGSGQLPGDDGAGNGVGEKTHFAVALGARLLINDRVSVLAEYIPVIGDRLPGTKDAFAIAINIETGGHVFQLFMKASDWLTEQHVITRNADEFFNGDIRLGFNVNRVFGFN